MGEVSNAARVLVSASTPTQQEQATIALFEVYQRRIVHFGNRSTDYLLCTTLFLYSMYYPAISNWRRVLGNDNVMVVTAESIGESPSMSTLRPFQSPLQVLQSIEL